MKHILALTFCFSLFLGLSQSSTLEFLDSTDVALLFSDQVKQDNEIRYPIFRVYPFVDEAGSHLLVLTERVEKNNDSIVAFCFQVDAGGNIEKLEWKISDFIEGHKENIHSEETAIWFWTKFLQLDDLDDNGVIDPIVVYGTSGDNGVEDGRLKMLVYMNGEKIGIRHQNSPMDFGRFTKVDDKFYELDNTIQYQVKMLMKSIEENGKVIFPGGWEVAMKAKKLKFDEN